MITADYVKEKLGPAIEAFAADSPCSVTYVSIGAECLYVWIEWVTPTKLPAAVVLYPSEAGYLVDSHVDYHPVQVGRRVPWNLPRQTLLANLRRVRRQVDSSPFPPVGVLELPYSSAA